MLLSYTLVGFLFLLVARPIVLSAADVTTKVVDGLGRPVANAEVNIHWLKSVSKGDARRIKLVKLTSNHDGNAKGNYDYGTAQGQSS